MPWVAFWLFRTSECLFLKCDGITRTIFLDKLFRQKSRACLSHAQNVYDIQVQRSGSKSTVDMMAYLSRLWWEFWTSLNFNPQTKNSKKFNNMKSLIPGCCLYTYDRVFVLCEKFGCKAYYQSAANATLDQNALLTDICKFLFDRIDGPSVMRILMTWTKTFIFPCTGMEPEHSTTDEGTGCKCHRCGPGSTVWMKSPTILMSWVPHLLSTILSSLFYHERHFLERIPDDAGRLHATCESFADQVLCSIITSTLWWNAAFKGGLFLNWQDAIHVPVFRCIEKELEEWGRYGRTGIEYFIRRRWANSRMEFAGPSLLNAEVYTGTAQWQNAGLQKRW